MDLLAQYNDSGSDEERPTTTSTKPNSNKILKRKLNSAPGVTVLSKFQGDHVSAFNQPVNPSSAIVNYNATAQAMWAPTEGPSNPYKQTKTTVHSTTVEPQAFDEQFNTFQQFQYAVDPTTGTHMVGNQQQAYARNGATVFTAGKAKKSKASGAPLEKPPSKDLGDADVDGPWAPMKKDEAVEVMSMEQEQYRKAFQQRKEEQLRIREKEDEPEVVLDGEVPNTSSKFFGKEAVDYQGRSWIVPPSDLKPSDDHECFIPKKCVHQWTGHKKGVQAIEFFPRYGQLLLSGSMDSTVKIWNVYDDRRLMRSYDGHSAAVRDINFSGDGSEFLSCSFDRSIKLWDTETGQCKSSFSNRKIPYCVRYYPLDNNLFIASCADKRIIQWDVRTGEIVQEYGHHLRAVNNVTFVDEGRRFVSTSDDKKLLVWEWNIPVPIKYISEPEMQSIPTLTLHPSGGFFAGQSMDNQIKVFETGEKTRQVRKKTFRGHHAAGFACQIGFSPNGKFIMSGDGNGKLFFWDWKSGRQYRKLNAHSNGPCMGAIWHPIVPSKVATCGWDGLIKLWD